MNTYDLLAQDLNKYTVGDVTKLVAWLRQWLSPESMGYSMGYGHDSDPVLVLKRVKPHLTHKAVDALALACGDLLEEFLAQPRQPRDYAYNLLRITDIVARKSLVPTLVEQLDRFALWNPIAVQVALAIILDSGIKQSEQFWKQVLVVDPASFSGFAMNGLLDIDIQEAAKVVPVMAHNNATANLTVLMLDLFYDKADEAQRQEVIAAVQAQIAKCVEAAQSPLQTWLDSKN